MEQFNLAVLPIPDMVFHPHTMVPVYIVEPSYVEMIKSCIEKNVALGVIIANPRTEHTVCTLTAPTILEELESGEVSVLLQGIGRAKLEQLVQHLPWPVFAATSYEDNREAILYDTEQMDRLTNILNSWLYKHIENSSERDRFLGTIKTVNHTIDYICMLILRDIEIKEMVLATTSLADRINMLNLLLKDTNPFEEDQTILKVLKSYDHMQKTSDIVQ